VNSELEKINILIPKLLIRENIKLFIRLEYQEIGALFKTRTVLFINPVSVDILN